MDSGELRFIRAIKPLRWFKIARIMKLGKFGGIIDTINDNLSCYAVISPHFSKTLQVMISLTLVIHLLACFWFLWKSLDMTLEEMNTSLDSENWGNHPRHELCTTLGKVEAYVLSIYLVAMTVTTVGYGDITAENTWERVGYTAFFVVCAFCWSELIAAVTVMTESREAKNQEKVQILQNTLTFLMGNDVPVKLRCSIIKWTRFNVLGVADWAESTCFYFPKPDPEPTEIRVQANMHEFVVVLQLDKVFWDEALDKSPVTQAAVAEWIENWKGSLI
jgi:hypothetical protein